MNIKKIMLAGGCFWCLSKPYYEYSGIIHVYSGYAGGIVKNPTYEDVKYGQTFHRETILIEYDADIISFSEILDIYFETIDPFDGEGQFIDRGYNYTCAIFTSNEDEKRIIKEKLIKLEQEFNLKTYVPILDEVVFYMAEEYHQDFAIKNKELMEKEWKESGRK